MKENPQKIIAHKAGQDKVSPFAPLYGLQSNPFEMKDQKLENLLTRELSTLY